MSFLLTQISLSWSLPAKSFPTVIFTWSPMAIARPLSVFIPTEALIIKLRQAGFIFAINIIISWYCYYPWHIFLCKHLIIYIPNISLTMFSHFMFYFPWRLPYAPGHCRRAAELHTTTISMWVLVIKHRQTDFCPTIYKYSSATISIYMSMFIQLFK